MFHYEEELDLLLQTNRWSLCLYYGEFCLMDVMSQTDMWRVAYSKSGKYWVLRNRPNSPVSPMFTFTIHSLSDGQKDFCTCNNWFGHSGTFLDFFHKDNNTFNGVGSFRHSKILEGCSQKSHIASRNVLVFLYYQDLIAEKLSRKLAVQSHKKLNQWDKALFINWSHLLSVIS